LSFYQNIFIWDLILKDLLKGIPCVIKI
jgi:hypothetical protein